MHVKEREVGTLSGIAMLFMLFAVLLAGIGTILWAVQKPPNVPLIVAAVLTIAGAGIGMNGLFIVNPNEGRVLQLFGSYMGTSKTTGLRWTNPFFRKTAISLRVRNFETGRLKVNDHDGNPIEIAAVVVWRVTDTAAASFRVEDYEEFTHMQAEGSLRNLATRYAYDAHEEGKTSLRGSTAAIAEQLRTEIQDRLAEAGVEVVEARISHLAYAPEIAVAMLRRQQAGAVVAARQKIVEGAVGMVEMALEMLSKKSVVSLDEERKAAMVSNLLVVLCGERETQPVVNTGTLHN
jgi:regulator of protease activity HflC (stomatin/prohibitin superfamily)